MNDFSFQERIQNFWPHSKHSASTIAVVVVDGDKSPAVPDTLSGHFIHMCIQQIFFQGVLYLLRCWTKEAQVI